MHRDGQGEQRETFPSASSSLASSQALSSASSLSRRRAARAAAELYRREIRWRYSAAELPQLARLQEKTRRVSRASVSRSG